MYYRFLRKKINLNTSLNTRESKWHAELNCTYGTDFWNKTYNLTSAIKNENKIKWLQFQINRNSLFTNYRVNKFKPNISPNCTFCSIGEGVTQTHPELVSHLFFDCDFVIKLWIEVKNWLRTINIDIPLDRKVLLFGCHDQLSNSVPNYILLCVKYFIWKSKFQSQELYLSAFQKYLKFKLDDLKNAYLYEQKEEMFDPFLIVYDCVSRLL